MKASKYLLSVVALAAAAFAGPASAQFYVGVGIGSAQTDGVNGSSTVAGVPVSVSKGDETAMSWKLLGGYQFTPNWGAEVQYTDLGKRNAVMSYGAPINQFSSTNSAKTDQWSIAATGTYPLAYNFSLMGKIGVSFNNYEAIEARVGGVTARVGSESKTDLLWGLGVGYRFTRNIGVLFEYENFGKFTSNNGANGTAVKADNWGVSLRYTF